MSAQVTKWDVLRQFGPAGQFHQRSPATGTGPEVWVRTIGRPALVLGSTQPEELIRRTRTDADGIEVCRRRSGGGLVWINPETDIWIDVIVPAGSPQWSDDVGRAFHWLGEAWAETLGEFVDPSTIHIARTSGRSPAGKIWCFADLGHGEVSIAGRKVVGLSQRRTRTWARLQGLVLGSWPGAALTDYVDMDYAASLAPDADQSALDPGALAAGLPGEVVAPNGNEVIDRFLDLLTTR